MEITVKLWSKQFNSIQNTFSSNSQMSLALVGIISKDFIFYNASLLRVQTYLVSWIMCYILFIVSWTKDVRCHREIGGYDLKYSLLLIWPYSCLLFQVYLCWNTFQRYLWLEVGKEIVIRPRSCHPSAGIVGRENLLVLQYLFWQANKNISITLNRNVNP